MKKTVLAAVLGMGFSAVFLAGCNSAPKHSKSWAELSRRNLPGVWTSDKYGELIISCQGFIHYDDRGGFDLENTGLKNAKIVELAERELVIETMPLIKSRYPMERYPYEEEGQWKMRFWDRNWSKASDRDCGSTAQAGT